MNALEIFIVYMACGAPFGVHFFLQNRDQRRRGVIFLKSFLTVVVWIPYALRLLNANVTKKISGGDFRPLREASNSPLREKLEAVQKKLVQALDNDGASNFTVFEIREVVERYAGLTAALMTGGVGEDEGESELLLVSNHPNIRLGTKCLSRRNRLRLQFHQTLARRDFLRMLARPAPAAEKLRAAALEFVTLLKDQAGARAVEILLAETAQITRQRSVTHTEKAVWKSREHKPLNGKTVSARTPTPTRPAATIGSTGKD